MIVEIGEAPLPGFFHIGAGGVDELAEVVEYGLGEVG